MLIQLSGSVSGIHAPDIGSPRLPQGKDKRGRGNAHDCFSGCPQRMRHTASTSIGHLEERMLCLKSKLKGACESRVYLCGKLA